MFSITNVRSLEVGILNIEGVELLELTMQGVACQTTYIDLKILEMPRLIKTKCAMNCTKKSQACVASSYVKICKLNGHCA